MEPGPDAPNRRLLSGVVICVALGMVVYLGWVGGRPRLSDADRARLLDEADQDLLTSRLADADRKFRRVAASDPTSARAAFGRGLVSLRSGRYEEAIAALDLAARLEPGNVDHEFVRAYTKSRMGRRGEAADLYASIVAADPSRVDAAEERIALLVDEGRWENARREATAALARAPERYRLRILAGRIESHLGDHETAIEQYARARAIRPNSPQPVYGLIEEYRTLNRIAEASALVPEFERLKSAAGALDGARAQAEARPSDPAPAARYAEKLLDAGRLDEGAEEVGSFLTRFPEAPGRGVLALKGAAAAARLGDASSARRFLGIAEQEGDLDLDASLTAADVLAEIGEDERARSLFETRLKTHPVDASAMVGIARIDLRRAELTDAESLLRRVLEADPRRADARALLGLLLIQKGDPPAGEVELNRALEADRDQVDALFGMGFLAHLRRDAAGAVRYLREALGRKPGHLQARVILALALSDEGRCEEAIPIFNRALAADYSNVSLHAGLIRCLELTGRVAEAEQAREVARKIAGAAPESGP